MAEPPTKGAAGGIGVATEFEADVTFTDGPGTAAAIFRLRGSVLTLVVPRAEDGGAAGFYRLTLDKHDALSAALSTLPPSVSGPPPSPDQPVASFVVRDKGQERQRQLVASRPTSDPRMDKILAELARCEKAARAKPAATVALEIQPPGANTKPGQAQTMMVRVMAKGEPGAEVRIDPGLVLLQAAPQPRPAAPGVTPLPPEWDVVSAPLAKSSPQAVKAGATLDLRLTVNDPSPEPRWVRAVYNGNGTLRASALTDEVRLRLASKAVPLGATPTGPRK